MEKKKNQADHKAAEKSFLTPHATPTPTPGDIVSLGCRLFIIL
jgi:hypothetical protein